MITFKDYFLIESKRGEEYHTGFSIENKLKDRENYISILSKLGVFDKLNAQSNIKIISLPDTYDFERNLISNLPNPNIEIYGVDYTSTKAFKQGQRFIRDASNNKLSVYVPFTKRKIVKFENVLQQPQKFINVTDNTIVDKPDLFDIVDYDTTTTALPEAIDAIAHVINNLTPNGFIHVTFTNIIRSKSYMDTRINRSKYDESDIINTTEPDGADFYELPEDAYIDEFNINIGKNIKNKLLQAKNANYTTADLINRGLKNVYVSLYPSKRGNAMMYSGVFVK
jgi:hypothetical protein